MVCKIRLLISENSVTYYLLKNSQTVKNGVASIKVDMVKKVVKSKLTVKKIGCGDKCI